MIIARRVVLLIASPMFATTAGYSVLLLGLLVAVSGNHVITS